VVTVVVVLDDDRMEDTQHAILDPTVKNPTT
jgi:hypothetical protein